VFLELLAEPYSIWPHKKRGYETLPATHRVVAVSDGKLFEAELGAADGLTRTGPADDGWSVEFGGLSGYFRNLVNHLDK
jgi:hypothetical protein